MEYKTKILIVDDEPINLDFFDVMLSKLGFQVEKAEDGEEALIKVKETNPDLIILDNIMPKLSGWQVTRILKNDKDYTAFNDIPIIMFSAMDDVKDKIEGFELGVDDYIIKPFNFSEVLARIRAVLRSRNLAKAIVRKERKITLIESLNKSLLYFTKHMKEPVKTLETVSKNTSPNDSKEVGKLIDMVRKESREILATLEVLEEEIHELESTNIENEKESEILEELEKKFQDHFRQLKEK